jgi:beta-mannosidase
MSEKITLDGTWQLRWNDGTRGGAVSRLLVDRPEMQRALSAQVPGSVHLDLMRAGLLDDPNEGLNVLKARWVEEVEWYYRRSFEARALQPEERAFLTFMCLDLVAVIYLNGKEIARHANAFYPCQVDVTNELRVGTNVLVVALESGLFHIAEKPVSGYGLAYDGRLHKRQWLRQTQSSFEWDWSPRLLNVGIRGDVVLEIARQVRLESFVALAELTQDHQKGLVTVRLFVDYWGEEPADASLTVQVGEIKKSESVNITKGSSRIETVVEVSNPKLWWPINHGSQERYDVTVALEVEGQKLTVTRKVGFCRIEIDQSPHPESGNYFIIMVNGKPIFCKGGNLVPADIILARLDRQRYAVLVERALEANFNILRVWGGGLYESDHLFELCDEKGILVWQEFIFACAKYPATDEHFLADVKREAVYQVRRLASHPALVVWCGNNELEWGTWDWNYKMGVAHPDYVLYHHVLPVILEQEDGTRYYQPSSPYSPDHQPPNRDDMGDQHPWSVGFGNTDFRDYRAMICRFPNEGGFLGPTALPTMQACLEGAGSPFHTESGAQTSFAFEVHDNSIASMGERTAIDQAYETWLGKNIMAMSLEDYAYWGGLLQGQALGEYIRNFRRRMFNTSSAIFWMYNDVWPATRSWTIVDYYGRRTPAFYPVRRAFQPVSVAIAVEGEQVEVYGINEGEEWKGNIHCGLFGLAGGYPLEIKKEVLLPGSTAIRIAAFPLQTWTQLGANYHGAFALLAREKEEVARDVLFLPLYKDLVWPKAEVQVRWVNGKASFECETFAWRVCLDLDGIPLPDNFFDVLPGIPTVLDWPEGYARPRILRVGNLV